jgi:hypothetical protein
MVSVEPSFVSKIDKAQTCWQVKYLICECMCKIISGSLENRIFLLNILTNLQKGTSSDAIFFDYLIQIVDSLSSIKQGEVRSSSKLLENQPDTSIAPFNVELSHIFENINETKVVYEGVPQKTLEYVEDEE